MSMDKDTFWQIIDEINSEVSRTDLDGIIEKTKLKLCADYSQQEIALWSNYQRFYCDLADTTGLFAASCCLNDSMSDDGFNDFRMWLISQGKEAYLAALKDPDSLAGLDTPKNTTRFEPYGYVAYDAYDLWDIHSASYSKGVWHMLTAYDQPESQEAEQQIEAGVRKQEIQSRLREKLDKGMDAFQKDWWQKTPSVLVGIAQEMAVTQTVYNELYGGDYCDGHLDELEYLLRFENPLEVVRDEYIRQDTPQQYIMETTLWELKQSQSAVQEYALDGDWNPPGMGQGVTMC